MAAHIVDSRTMLERGRAEDVKEGIDAFLQKRPAVFPDRVSTDLPANFPWWPARPAARR